MISLLSINAHIDQVWLAILVTCVVALCVNTFIIAMSKS
jgi:hypothetical protein